MSSEESTYEEELNNRKKKRRKGNDGLPTPLSKENFTLRPLLDLLEDAETPLEDSMEQILPEYLRDRAIQQERQAEKDGTGQLLRPLTRSDVSSFVDTAGTSGSSVSQAVALRKLKVAQERRRAGLSKSETAASLSSPNTNPNLTEIPPATGSATPLSEHTARIVEALESIKTTPFENSFLARLHGVSRGVALPGLVSVDWETVTPWMALLRDIRDHHSFAHPEREWDRPTNTVSPITYSSLQPWHLDQVHDLLGRAFWSGIDVTDSLEYSPERCTIVAAYGRLVVGVAIISSPRETYITYLAVRAGWDNTQIATTMLYHLISLNPHQDITLHVSANNSAMLLYNRFGFKAEEFVAGFYDAYLDPQSRVSKNAFRLRLRQH
ncbi:hypothetical protein B0H16DRAFT_1504773 [Mycena metata]|uniref:N-acetyltransferase domain-containing protein n=1 Tax=Mycena metata TaxID=1033252 RepID=A0AAD7K7F7_9AGAR|nr:hypothetical protein B0H16DRAFT_1504773 [Mycena metata]